MVLNLYTQYNQLINIFIDLQDFELNTKYMSL